MLFGVVHKFASHVHCRLSAVTERKITDDMYHTSLLSQYAWSSMEECMCLLVF